MIYNKLFIKRFCHVLHEIDNQTDAESLFYQYLPEVDIRCDMFGFLNIALKGESTDWKDHTVRIGMIDEKWVVISSPFASLVEKENSKVENHLTKLLKGISIKPDYAMIYNNLGLLFINHLSNSEKAKEFYNQILSYKKSNEKIILETQKRLRRDFSE